MLKRGSRPILDNDFGSLDLDWLNKDSINGGGDKKRLSVYLRPSLLVSEFDSLPTMDHKELVKLSQLPVLEKTPGDLEAAFACVALHMRVDPD